MVVLNVAEIIFLAGYRRGKKKQKCDNMIYNISFILNIFSIKMSICQ